MNLKEWLVETYEVNEGFIFLKKQIPNYPGDEILNVRKRLICEDGFSMSVQASNVHYCMPRENLSNGEYTEIEIGFPSEKEPLIYDYAEDSDNYRKTVYAYVPADIVDQVIKKHGGISK